MQGGGSSALKNLSKLMQAVESFYHPSNLGKHTVSITYFLQWNALELPLYNIFNWVNTHAGQPFARISMDYLMPPI